MTAYDTWYLARTSIVIQDGKRVVIDLSDHDHPAEAAAVLHDHIVASFNANESIVEGAGLSVEVDGEFIALHEVDAGMVAVLDPAEARALGALLLRLADETVSTGLMADDGPFVGRGGTP